MDITPTTPEASTPDENGFRRTADVFLHHGPNTQRFPRGHVNYLAAASSEIHKKSDARGESSRSSKRAKQVAQRPQCTHVVVIRVHGNNRCHICNKLPTTGWLYACQQDHDVDSSKSIPDTDIVPEASDVSDCFAAQARIAEQLKMSASVVQGIRDHDYNIDQVERLLNQRRAVIETIRKAQRSFSHEQRPLNSFHPDVDSNYNVSIYTLVHVAPDGVSGGVPNLMAGHDPYVTATRDDQQNQQVSKAANKPQSTCDFQVCHACRPGFADRLYSSFETVLSGDTPCLTEEEMDQLPVIDTHILSTIGLQEGPEHRQPNDQSEERLDKVGYVINDSEEEISVDWTPTDSSASDGPEGCSDGRDGHPDTDNNGNQILQDPLDRAEVSSSETPTHDQMFNKPKSITPDNPEDLPWRMVIDSLGTPGGASTASSISLPTPSTSPMVSLFPTDDPFETALLKRTGRCDKARSSWSGLESHRLRRPLSFSRHESSSSSLGSEMEVEGGVALTEEAVETGMPDLFTEDVVTM